MRDVFIVAGETSGDLHGAGFATSLGRLRPDLQLTGIGGAKMAEAGVQLMERSDRMSVMGFVEVLRTIPHHASLLRAIGERFRSGSIGLVVLLDYPGFNMRVARLAKAANIPVLYYITPQVWAWGAGRLTAMRELVTKAAVILPFEEKLLRSHGIDATFVGHPLLDRMGTLPSRTEARATLGLAPDRRVLALFPGSRRQEVGRHLDAFLATARRLEEMVPGLQVMVSGAAHMELGTLPYPVIREASVTVLRAADAALCKSGTTTLEAAVADCPLIVAYRTSAWTHAIAKRLVSIPRIGLVNVVAGRALAPEFVQNDVRPAEMAVALAPLLTDGAARATQLDGLRAVREALGTPGAADRAAAMASTLLP